MSAAAREALHPSHGAAMHAAGVQKGMSFGIDLLRHGLCLAVIVQHMPSSRYSAETMQGMAVLADWVQGAVLGFFFIAGYLFKPMVNPLQYAKRQTWRLLVPYLLFSLAYTVLLAALGKGTWSGGLLATLALQGAGMQLYFLPFLWIVSVAHAVPFSGRGWRVRHAWFGVAAGWLVLSAMWPTTSPTGPSWRLLPLYACAHALGAWTAQLSRQGTGDGLAMLVALGIGAAGWYDPRLFDVGGVMLLVWGVLHLRRFFPEHRLPGSGGVYLLHTPVLNFTISSLLQQGGVSQGWNIAASVALSYGLCLALTLQVTRRWPSWRWLMLE